MRWLSDETLTRLRAIVDLPDLEATKYRILEELGRGGMGTVYLAEDDDLQRTVALKVLTLADSSGEASTRMRREAHVLAKLEHPGIVPIHDIGELPDGRVFYTMKLVRGAPLDEYCAAHPISERLRVFERLCEPVALAHSKGIVHRDLKPRNIMVGEFGEVLVLDWGVAAGVGEDHPAIAGTAAYMPPEQSLGKAVDARSDIYALGKILRSVCGEDRDKRLLAIIAKATAIDPLARYASALNLAADISRYREKSTIAAYREAPWEIAARLLSRNKAIVGLIVAYILMRAMLFFWMGR